MRVKEAQSKVLKKAIDLHLLGGLTIRDLNEQILSLTLQILKLRRSKFDPWAWQRLVRTWIILNFLATPPS